MAYKTLLFLGIFLITSVTAYSLCPKKFRKYSLLIVSAACYAFFSQFVALFLAATIVTTYFAAKIIDGIGQQYSSDGLSRDERKALKAKLKSKKRAIFIVYLILNLGFLAVLKYFNFFAGGICSALSALGFSVCAPVLKVVMPLGISYYTLQAMGYVIDVMREKNRADKSIWNVALFIAYFPQLNEGPFGRYSDLMPQLEAGADIQCSDVFAGVGELLYGLFKLFVVADRAAIITTEVFGNFSKYSGFAVVIGVFAFTLQLYAEFSGYINIAKGISKIFGIELAKNFDMPFISQNVGEFWRRWHISLGTWFKDYVFYPVSTSKFLRTLTKKLKPQTGAKLTVILSLLAVWFLTGLWHGASMKYIVYGLYYYVLMMIYNRLSPPINKFLEKKGVSPENKGLKTFRIIRTFLLVQIGMLIFKAKDLTVFSKMLLSIFTPGKGSLSVPGIEISDLILLLCATLLLIFYAILKLKGISLEDKYNALSPFKKYWICFAIVLIVAVFGAYGLGYTPPDPIYGGF